MKKAFIFIPIVASILATSGRATNARRTLTGHVPEVVEKLQPAGRLEPSRRLKLAIGLASRDEQGLDAFIQELYDPASPNYHHYLSPEQFTERFAPTEQEYKALVDYAKASGLNVTHQHSNRVVLDVEGAVTNIENALQVTLRTYPHPTEARTFFAPDVDPSLPAGVAALRIAGLNNYTLPHPKHKRRAIKPGAGAIPGGAKPKEGSAPGGELWGNDFRDAYAPGTTLNGAGQSVGLVEFEGFYGSDITDYENAIGINPKKRPQLMIVSLDGGATAQDSVDNGEECSIDIEMAVAIAPGLSNIYVFEAPEGFSDASFDDIFESMVTYTNVLQFSCSWGGGTSQDPTSEVLFKQMASQGQSFFDASGDDGAFVGAVEFPSDSPSITQVGGTTLTDGGAPSYSWQSEVVWAWDSGPNVSGGEARSSGGGLSTYYGIPNWQTNISMTANLGSLVRRNIPDVSANADNGYVFSDDGQTGGGFGGTSFAAPLWAGFTALVNQQAAANGEAPVGFLNPALYAIAAGTNYAGCFHDITSGDNTWRRSPSLFFAVPGYDLCCGLGTPTGTNLINALAPPVLSSPPVLAIDVNSRYVALAGHAVTIAASFNGAAPFTYQWLYNGQPIFQGAGITGGTSNILTLQPVLFNEAGTYQLLATNAYGHSESSAAVLSVVPLPQVGGVTMSGSNFIFSYPTSSGASYQLQFTTDLNSGIWLPAGSAVIGTGTPVSMSNNITTGLQKFFRLSVSP